MKTLAHLDIPSFNRFAVGFDNWFDELSRTAGRSNSNYPPYNIAKINDTNYVIEIAVAGFSESELDVEVANHELVIRGDRQLDETDTTVQYLHHGIAARNFVRTFALAENVVVKSGTVSNGILRIDLEAVVPEEAKPKKIQLTFSK